MLLLAAPLSAGAEFDPNKPIIHRMRPQTSLEAEAPQGTFVSEVGTTRLRRARVKVKNIGKATADGIRVAIITPNGTKVEANGPDSLMPRSEGTYTCYPAEYVGVEREMNVEVSCENCSQPQSEKPQQ